MQDREPLDGVTVISLAVNLPGPLAAARLQSLGARVIKVEPPQGDPLTFAVREYYDELTVGQDVVTIDLKDPTGCERLDTLAAEADIVLTAMRPRAAAALGLPELIDRHNLVHVEIVGFSGDRADVPGHDLTYQAAHATLVPGTMPTVPIADVLGSENAVVAALAGLRQRDLRQRDLRAPGQGGGIVRRVVLDEAAAWAAGPARHGLSSPGGHLGGGSPFYRTYATADGHVAVACIEPHFAKALATQLGSEHEQLKRAFAAQPTAHWTDFAAEHDLPIEEIAHQ
ncbi:CoA transferase [Brevibacterium spongiae]|uniref:CoA transferase n=1 Tax=Brevibacterium spongiae TaxID=2909672 RepID=A0ABY5SR87_9MICO|nr:CoA transferase [Brevibacterium spongiae]UVI36719.1 CoA transferase [Brevibacterium spongiae]